jgi:aarF domain-containing kinase
LTISPVPAAAPTASTTLSSAASLAASTATVDDAAAAVTTTVTTTASSTATAATATDPSRPSTPPYTASPTPKGAAETTAQKAERSAENVRRMVAVPASPLARVFGFGQLAAGLAAGTLSESARRAWNGKPEQLAKAGTGDDDDSPLIGGGSVFMTEANAERLAVALCRMRGAALKLGQMLSMQDENVIPPQIQRALERVRQGADTMPPAQLHRAIEDQLGSGWRDKLVSFDEEPLAAASIGQVHRAVYAPKVNGEESGGTLDVCMKIQYPGVARSIHSDIDNLMRLVSLTDLIPRGLFVEHAVKVAKEELTLECDYEYEKRSQLRMAEYLRDDPHWNVPDVIEDLCSKGVLTTTFAPGMAIDKASELPQV